MPFGVVSGSVEGLMCYLYGVEIVKSEWAFLGVNVGHPIVINGDFVALVQWRRGSFQTTLGFLVMFIV